MSAGYPFPRPTPSPVSQPFWDAAKRDRLVVQTCDSCGHRQYPPQTRCVSCYSAALSFQPASGRGAIYITSAVFRPQVADAPVPYIVAIAEMEEGWKLMCNLVDFADIDIPVGMPVKVVFIDAGEGMKVPALVNISRTEEG
jgi:uncharacterized OB-fold protein